MTDTNHRFHTLVLHVENKSGVLARVAGLFARRGFNIDSLAVAPTSDPRLSRITCVVDLESATLEQIVKQTDKLINVVDIAELDPASSVERELMLVTIEAPPARRPEILGKIERFDATVVSEGESQMMLSLVDESAVVDDLEHTLRPYGIVDLQRTGRVSLPSVD